MHFSLLLLVTATLSYAHYYPMEGEAPALAHSRHFQNRRGGPLDEGDVCHVKTITPEIYNTVLNKEDVAICQAQLLDWTMQSDSSIPASTGGTPGFKKNANTVDCQVCNFDSQPRHVTPEDLKRLFDAIKCGSYENPQMGFGYTDALEDHGFYVAYGPKDTLPNCYPCEHCDGGLENAD